MQPIMSAAIFLKSNLDFWIFITNLDSTTYIFLLVGEQTLPMEVLIIEIVVYLSLSLFVAIAIWAVCGICKIFNIPALGSDPKSEPDNCRALPDSALWSVHHTTVREVLKPIPEVIEDASPASVCSPHKTVTLSTPRGPDVGLVFIPKFEKEVLI